MIRPANLTPALALTVALAVIVGGCGTQPPPASPTAQPASPQPTLDIALAGRLVAPGDTLTLDAVDADGIWGAITVVRGEDVGGYAMEEIADTTFVVEIRVVYEAERHPIGDVGSVDWALATADDLVPVGRLIEAPAPPNPSDWDPDRQSLGIYPGAMDLTGQRVLGLLAFQVDRTFADEDLVLVYRPRGARRAPIVTPVRRASDPPAPVPTATPVPTPAPVRYVGREGLPITVIEHAEADALFADTRVCSTVVGFSVPYPASWFADPGCRFFAPEPVDGPADAAIVITVVPGAMGSFDRPDLSLDETLTIDRLPAWRMEQIGVWYHGTTYEALPPTYAYHMVLAESPAEGPTMSASIDSTGVPDYVLTKAVLDRMMAGMTIDDTP